MRLLIAAGACLIAASGGVLAQGFPWPFGGEFPKPPTPREPVYRPPAQTVPAPMAPAPEPSRFQLSRGADQLDAIAQPDLRPARAAARAGRPAQSA